MNGASALDRIRIVLSHPSHPGNIGAVARAMKTMGLGRLCLVNPRAFPHPEADAMACGAVGILRHARICASVVEALAGCVQVAALTARRRDLSAPSVSPREAAAELVRAACDADVALLFGNETSGLSNEETGLCQRIVTIPTCAEYASLNLAAAVQVLCYELRLAAACSGDPPVRQGEPASFEEVERFYTHLERALVRSGFLDPQTPKRLMPRLRRMFARAGLEKEEINILRGMLRSFESKLD
jgi:tRNA/rRNA methyltransferase